MRTVRGFPRRAYEKGDGKGAAWIPGIVFPSLVRSRGQFSVFVFQGCAYAGKAGYQGRFCDIYRYEFDAQNVQTALDAGLVDETTTPEDGSGRMMD